MEKTLKVFAIIVTYKGRQWYDRCFSSLQESTIPVEIVVIDNASGDGSVDFIQGRFPQIKLICSDKNLGFGQANNLGMRYALDNGCDYVFLLNQDAWVEPDTIEKLIDIHSRNRDYGILSPIHLTPDKYSIEKGLLTYLDDYKTTDRAFFEDLYFDRVKDLYQSSFINAAVWLLPRITLETVGGFDPIFFHYEEDDNYLQRVLYHNLKVGICPLATAIHDCNNKGVRVYSSEEAERRRLSSLLVRYTDVTKDVSIGKNLLYYLRKAAISFLRGQFKDSRQYLSDLFYIHSKKKAIAFSLSTNRETGPKWL